MAVLCSFPCIVAVCFYLQSCVRGGMRMRAPGLAAWLRATEHRDVRLWALDFGATCKRAYVRQVATGSGQAAILAVAPSGSELEAAMATVTGEAAEEDVCMVCKVGGSCSIAWIRVLRVASKLQMPCSAHAK
jgi:hypothetical protein